jgi:hypothetical protein
MVAEVLVGRMRRAGGVALIGLLFGGCGLARMNEEPDPDKSTATYFQGCRKPGGEYDTGCAVGHALWALITGDAGD